mgnify:FL=1
MKIHGTAKGGAISKKDFGVAFGGGGAPAVKFDNFVCKWNSGGATIIIGISTLDYITTNGNDEAGLQYGFMFRTRSTKRYAIVEDGSPGSNVNLAIDSDTEFKLTYDGTDMKWFVDGVEKNSSTVSLSGTFYLWTNNNNPDGTSDPSIQCQYNDSDATWTGVEPANWTVSNPSVTKSSGTSWGSGIYATAQSSTE